MHWKDWCWSWSSNTLATWYKELTHLIRPWCWERLGAGREASDRGWGGWMASLTQWTWVRANSGRWWRTGNPGVLQSMGSQRRDLVTEQQSSLHSFLKIHPLGLGRHLERAQHASWRQGKKGLPWKGNFIVPCGPRLQLTNLRFIFQFPLGCPWPPLPLGKLGH